MTTRPGGVRWTLLATEAAPGWWHMATDASLLDLSILHHQGYLRLYTWEPHGLSFGRHEPAARRYRRDLIQHEGYDVVRRPTGGRAVWHGRELTYAVTAPETWFGSLREAYQTIHATLASALRRLGAEARLADPSHRPSGLDAGACFASPVGGEVMVAGGKVVGSAQVRRPGGFLQHGSILLDDDQAVLTRVTRGTPPASQAMPLNRALAEPVSAEDVAAAVTAEAQRWPGTWVPDRHAAERERLVDLHAARFRDPEWTWRR